jgi:hypothetical protein
MANVSSDFRVKNGLIIGSAGTGSLCGGSGLFTTSLSSAALSGDGRALTTNFTISAGGDVDNVTRNITALNGTYTLPLELKDTAVTPGSYGSTTQIPNFTVDADGRLTSAGTNTVATTLSTIGDTGTGSVSLLTQQLTLAGTTNEIETSSSGQTVTIGLPDDVIIAGNLTVNGTHTTLNTSVTSTTTATENNFVIRSTDDGADASPDLKLWRDSSDPDDDDEIGNIFFTGTNSAEEATDYAHILGQITDVTNGSEDGRLTFKTMSGGTLSDRLTINSGSVGIGTTTPNEALTVSGNLSASGCVDAPALIGTTSVSSPSVCGTTSVCSPLVCGSTSAESPLVCGTTIVCSPTVHGTTLVCGAAVCGSTSVCSPLVCGSTSVCSPLVCGSTSAQSPLVCGTTSVNTPIVFATSCVDIGGDTKFYRNAANVIRTPDGVIVDGALSINTTDITSANVTIDGTLSASGIIYADAFNSRTGGSAISFNDDLTLTGTLSATDDIVHVGDPDTKLSFTTDLITLYAGNSNLLRVDGTNVVGIGTVTTASPSIPTVVEFNNNTTAYKSASATIANGAMASLLKIPIADYRAGKIVLQAVAASGGHMDVTELLYIHNGTDVHTTEYGTIHITGTAVATISAVISSGNVEIRTTNTSGVEAEVVGSITMLSVT